MSLGFGPEDPWGGGARDDGARPAAGPNDERDRSTCGENHLAEVGPTCKATHGGHDPGARGGGWGITTEVQAWLSSVLDGGDSQFSERKGAWGRR
ncbi:Methylthioribose-1-phosphate isomerase (M1Pi) (MTR-1-P isomerase) [Psidium guajava]|nr:Methylthioribose-1-phosphate isomerase (M1Pi) (MTR-1-P isomerase) [Psidium guajava]